MQSATPLPRLGACHPDTATAHQERRRGNSGRADHSESGAAEPGPRDKLQRRDTGRPSRNESGSPPGTTCASVTNVRISHVPASGMRLKTRRRPRSLRPHHLRLARHANANSATRRLRVTPACNHSDPPGKVPAHTHQSRHAPSTPSRASLVPFSGSACGHRDDTSAAILAVGQAIQWSSLRRHPQGFGLLPCLVPTAQEESGVWCAAGTRRSDPARPGA
jgi:hypothetical protein